MIELIQGDCLSKHKKIKDQSVDLLLTDLPYGTTTCKWDTIIPFDKLWLIIDRIMKPNGAVLLFGQEPFSSYLRISNIDQYRYDWIWDKVSTTNFANAKKMPLSCNEVISVFYKALPTYNPQMTDAKQDRIRPISKPKKNESETNHQASGVTRKYSKGYDNTKRYPRKIIEVSSKLAECNSVNRVHPTQKPLLLLETLIKTYTNENDLVVDLTMGSGSTMIACQNTNRNGIGIELDESYFAIAKKRVEEKRKEKENEAQTLFNKPN
jgi:site-specific DNA-methyltransferase (adenine-specific)